MKNNKRKTKPAILYFAFLLIPVLSMGQAKIIFDTDFGGDADDLGALAMLNHFQTKEKCTLLAVMVWSTETYAVPAIDAVNTFYKHPDIPIAVRKDGAYHEPWNYSKSIADALPSSCSYETAPDATFLYRKILADSEDKSISIVTVGPLKNIENLLNSRGDSISPLSGKELVHRKVREFVIMGGQFPEGKNEWNFNGNMPGVTRRVLESIDVPIVFSGYETGVNIRSGEVFNELDKNHPLYLGFMHFSANAPWIKKDFKGKILDNASYDQTAVLYAILNGTGTYWEKVSNGICLPDDHGGNKWIEKEGSNHSYLKLTMPEEEIAQIIEDFMLGNF